MSLWQFHAEGANDGHTNMSRDVELLQLAEQGTPSARVYSWHGPWVSLGTSQRPDRDLLDPTLIPWVMRPTGGKAVLHGHDVTIGLAVPLSMIGDPEKLSRSIKTVYRFVIRPLVEALNDCGVPAALAEETPFAGKGPKTSDCFAHISPNDVVDRRTGVKVCGCALKLTAQAVLVQASLPAGQPLIAPQRIFAQPQTMSTQEWDSEMYADSLERQLRKL